MPPLPYKTKYSRFRNQLQGSSRGLFRCLNRDFKDWSNDFATSDTILSWANSATCNSTKCIKAGAYPADAPSTSGEWIVEVIITQWRRLVRVTQYNTITPLCYIRSIYNNAWQTGWVLKDDLSVKVITSGSVFALPDGRYYCAAAVANMPNSSYGYVEVATWGDEKFVKVYDLKANANMYLNTYANGAWAGWTVK